MASPQIRPGRRVEGAQLSFPGSGLVSFQFGRTEDLAHLSLTLTEARGGRRPTAPLPTPAISQRRRTSHPSPVGRPGTALSLQRKPFSRPNLLKTFGPKTRLRGLANVASGAASPRAAPAPALLVPTGPSPMLWASGWSGLPAAATTRLNLLLFVTAPRSPQECCPQALQWECWGSKGSFLVGDNDGFETPAWPVEGAPQTQQPLQPPLEYTGGKALIHLQAKMPPPGRLHRDSRRDGHTARESRERRLATELKLDQPFPSEPARC